MENIYLDFVLNAALIGGVVECIVILIDYVFTSLLSQMGRG